MASARPWHNRSQPQDGRREPARLIALVLATGSCTTMQVAAVESEPLPRIAAASISMEIPEAFDPGAGQAGPAAPADVLTGFSAFQANATLPLAGPGVAAPSTSFLASANPVARLRAHDCLAQAIYYEAGNQSEDGQRAVAQVVLNRVRHPAWPNSVCGVVYQGAMRPGGGCQFTFTCDGALRRAPQAAMWARARHYASEALAGRVFAPVGLSTFYHANYVMPRWAPRLTKTAVIDAHIFYRLPGAGGQPGAFRSAYAGAEPVARPNPTIVRYGANGVATITAPEWLAPPAGANAGVEYAPPAGAAPRQTPSFLAADPAAVEESRIRPEYRNSGQWRTDAPSAITGR